VSLRATTIFDLASQLAAHSDFAGAWVQKLWHLGQLRALRTRATGEFRARGRLFADSNYDWHTWRWRSSPFR